jgi:glycerophosphoryl diester phosphodiesterase
VSAYQRSGLRVWGFTARTTDELRTAWNLRVNGVFTDLPAQARAMYHPPT